MSGCKSCILLSWVHCRRKVSNCLPELPGSLCPRAISSLHSATYFPGLELYDCPVLSSCCIWTV